MSATAPTIESAPDADRSARDWRQRRARRSGAAQSLVVRGEPMLWLTGSALGLSLFMIVGLLLRGVKPDHVARGMVVAAPRSIEPRARFTAEVYVLRADEGGRRTPIFDGYKPHWHRLSDTPDKVSGPQLAEAAKVATAWLQTLR